MTAIGEGDDDNDNGGGGGGDPATTAVVAAASGEATKNSGGGGGKRGATVVRLLRKLKPTVGTPYKSNPLVGHSLQAPGFISTLEPIT
jgi:hypothetical protein